MKSLLLSALIVCCFASAIKADVVVFTNDFNSTLPTTIKPGAAVLTDVQSYADLGPAGNRFGGSFLRSPTGNRVLLTLSNLPPHNVLNVAMLFAAIDSLDGTGSFPSGDFFTVTLNSNVVFRESFANATLQQIQSYVPPPGAELARHMDLGFSGPGGYHTDSAYNLGLDSRFQNLPHTESFAVLTFEIEGEGIQDLSDESWAMDNLMVSASTASNLTITEISPVGSEVRVTWTSVSNLIYRVQAKTNLTGASWVDLASPITATNTSAHFIEPLNGATKFYRIKLVAP